MVLKQIGFLNKMKYALAAILVFGLLISCNNAVNTEGPGAELPNIKHYVSIDGLWRCTPETASKFPHGTLEYIIHISDDAPGEKTARGCFVREGRFFDYWEIDSFQFNECSGKVVFTDNEGGKYIGTIDQVKKTIKGYFSPDDDDPTDTMKLDFVRDQAIDLTRFFIPYPTEQDGSIIYSYHQPEKCNDQIQTASMFEFVEDSSAFFNFMEKIIKQKFGRLESFLIIKDQELVLEEYFYGFSRTQLHRINSCTKSIISLLLGITLEHHKILDIEQPVFNFFPQYDSLITPEKEKISIKHLVTMTAGFPEEDDFEAHDPDDLVKKILSQPLVSAPGEHFKYNNNNTNLLGSLIYALENKQADEFAKEVLFNRLGIADFYWEEENGLLQCHNGLYMYPRDMAKIGLLVLNDGMWNGEEIVPKKWITESTKPYVSESVFFDYGYQWWYRSKRNSSWWDDPVHGSNDEHDMILALGFGGQYIMIVKDMNLVIVITSSDNNENNGKALQKVSMVIEYVEPLFD